MAQLAIKGHSTRGKEVIEILEMLDGIDTNNLYGDENYAYYTIDSDNEIKCGIYVFGDEELLSFTLEEFLEKYPYKVGDKVYYNNRVCNIIDMHWNSNLDTISYGVYDGKIKNLAIVEELQPYKEETNIKTNKCTQCVYAVNNNHCGLRGFTSHFNLNYCSAQNIDKLPNGFELQEDGYFSWVNKKQYQYPKTYEECAKELGYNLVMPTDHILGYKGTLLSFFQQLLICRDAYWKIAGDEMGLGKPWEPDYKNGNQKKYCIYNNQDNIKRFVLYCTNSIFSFPTEEMRDAFYENFKDLIEDCKELL